MKLAIMQPYFLPYIGYFQLIFSVDKFVLYDNVNYINRGWVNRNRVLMNGQPTYITIPLQNASQNRLINDIQIIEDNKWREKLLKSIDLNYKKAPFFEPVRETLTDIMGFQDLNLARFLNYSLTRILKYVQLEKNILISSNTYDDVGEKGQHRILSICKSESADVYHNPIGGMEIYSKELFNNSGVQLCFLKTKEIEYQQFKDTFFSNLSILDVLMFNSVGRVYRYLGEYELI